MADQWGGAGLTTDAWEFDLGRNIAVRGVDEFKLKMHDLVPEVRKALEEAISADGAKMRDRARALASGQVIQSRTGKFVASIQYQLRSDDSGVFATVYSNDPRDALFEFGGSTPARDILPNAREALRFMGGSALMNVLSLGTAGMVFAAVVHRPVVNYPKRPIIHAAFDEMEPQLEHDIDVAAHGVIIEHGL